MSNYPGLNSFHKRHYKNILFKEQQGLCYYCATPLELKSDDLCKHATLDHYIPVSSGGSIYDMNNLVLACYMCNTEKANMHPDIFINEIYRYYIIKRSLKSA